MKAMKRIIFATLLFMASVLTPLKGQTLNSEDNNLYVRPDTIVRVDTIVVREIIERTDVIHRTETVIKREETVNGSSVNSTTRTTSSGQVLPVIAPWIDTPSIPPSNPAQQETTATNNRNNASNSLYNDNILPQREGGNYIWIPTEMEGKVNDILTGRSFVEQSNVPSWRESKGIGHSGEEFDPNEKVTFRGDTLSMVLKDRNLGRFDRGLFNFLFIPKGMWQVGLTASYGEFSTEDLDVLDFISDIDFNGKIFSVKPYFSYFIKNNMSIGARLSYSRGLANIGSFNLDIDEDMNFNLHDIYYRSETATGSITFTQYLGITRRGRFGVFNEVELALGAGRSDFNRPFNGALKKTHTRTIEVGLNFSPGLCVYIIEPISFNVSFGVFGLHLKNEKQTVDGESLGSRTTSGANFRFNIFNINFGIAVNI